MTQFSYLDYYFPSPGIKAHVTCLDDFVTNLEQSLEDMLQV